MRLLTSADISTITNYVKSVTNLYLIKIKHLFFLADTTAIWKSTFSTIDYYLSPQ